MNAYSAEVPEIVRSHRKDVEYLEVLRQGVRGVAEKLLGPLRWSRWYEELGLASDLIYFGVTTLSALQSVGEEYISLVQVSDAERRQVPSFSRRALFVLFQVGGPYLVGKLLTRLEAHFCHENYPHRSRDWCTAIAKKIHWLKVNLDTIFRIHLALFYLSGDYYHLAKRTFGVQYLSLRPQSNSDTLKLFRFLGYLILAQAAANVFLWIRSLNISSSKITPPGSEVIGETAKGISSSVAREPSRNNFKCGICLETGNPPACTPCGHLFCWTCLVEQATSGGDCPTCRQEFTPDRVIPVLNF